MDRRDREEDVDARARAAGHPPPLGRDLRRRRPRRAGGLRRARRRDRGARVTGADAGDAAARDLTLMLAYLASWEEGPSGARRCWKGFRFEDLDALAEQGLIEDSRRAK